MSQVKAPQIAHFEVPFQIWTTASLLLFLMYTTSVPQHSTCNFWWLARVLRYDTFPDALFPAVWAFVGIVHVAEGVYAATLARKHNMPWHIAVRQAILFSFFCRCHDIETWILTFAVWSRRRLGSASPRSLACPC
jgi:hypothetical protein